MEQNQQQSQQQQWQGTERRQSLGPYQGADRRQPPYAPVKEPSPDDGTRPLRTQERKDEQEERARQQQRDQSDTH